MRMHWLFLTLSLCLSGCIGALFSDNSRYSDVPYPDIRQVPPRPQPDCKKTASYEAHIEELETRRDAIEEWRDDAVKKDDE